MATTTVLPTGAAFGAGLRMLGNETSKGLRVMWLHKARLILQLALMSVMYWIVQFFVGGGRFVYEVLAMTLQRITPRPPKGAAQSRTEFEAAIMHRPGSPGRRCLSDQAIR